MINEPQIRQGLYDWLTGNIGKECIKKINFDVDFVAGNIIDGTINGKVLNSVPFDTDHATTLKNLALEMVRYNFLRSVQITGARELTLTASKSGVDLVIVGPTVTGGVSQAVATVSIIQLQTTIPVTFSSQEAPRPLTAGGQPYPFATITISNVQGVGGSDDFRGIKEDEGFARWYGLRRATISIDFFNKKQQDGTHFRIFEEALKAYASLSKDSVLQELALSGIAIQQKESIQNLTNLLESIYEEHVNFDFFIGFSETFEDNPGFIESVEVSGTINDKILPLQTIDS